MFIWLVADGWCWFVLREKYYWLTAGGWFLQREKYCWLVTDKLSEQGRSLQPQAADASFTGAAHFSTKYTVYCVMFLSQNK
jgi:hypothetical protein